MRGALTLVHATALLVACGRVAQTGQDATIDGESADASSKSDAGPIDAKADKQWPIVYDIVDGGGDSPDCYSDGGGIIQSCCNGQPCHGFCILDDGSIECSCYGIPGGCGGVNACCATIRGCTVSFCGPWNGM